MNFKIIISLTVAFLFFGCLLALPNCAIAGEKWLRTGETIFEVTTVNNIDIINRGSGQFRAYFMRNSSIESTLSSDNGATFSEEGVVISAGGHFAAFKLESGDVRIYHVDGASGDLLSSITNDGFTFTLEDGVRISAANSGGIVHPRVLQLEDGSFKMYYDKKLSSNELDFGKQILSASSSDGLTFTKDPGVRISVKKFEAALDKDISLVFSPYVELDDEGKVKLYFTVETENKPKKTSGVYRATSTNGIKFKIQKKPVLKIDPAVTNPTNGVGGLTGNPQDAFIITDSNDIDYMYVWQSERGYVRATRQN